jgi:hypothetical protein
MSNFLTGGFYSKLLGAGRAELVMAASEERSGFGAGVAFGGGVGDLWGQGGHQAK